jgi:RNA polymerase sigma-70 factor, ECF subfamily
LGPIPGIENLLSFLPTLTLDFDKIFAESSPSVWRVLGRLGVAKADLADVCQEVFLIVYRRLGDYDGRAPVLAWIYGICVRQAADYRKRAHRRHEMIGEPPDTGVPPEQQRYVEVARARARLQAALTELDDGKREVFVLYEFEGLTMKQIAAILDCSIQTAYSRLHAARKAVAAAFDAGSEDFEAS